MKGSLRHRGFTLMEVMVVMTVMTLVTYLVSSSVRAISRFYSEVSTQSRTVGSATMVLDKIQNLCFGLPKQAVFCGEGPENLLFVHPLDTVGATGEAVYSDRRVIVQSDTQGVNWWIVKGQSRDLGAPLKMWLAEPGPDVLRRTVLGQGWSFRADFTQGHFPLVLKVTSPGPVRKTFQRTVDGF